MIEKNMNLFSITNPTLCSTFQPIMTSKNVAPRCRGRPWLLGITKVRVRVISSLKHMSTQRIFGSVINRQPCLASIAKLKSLISQKPIRPSDLGAKRQSQALQWSFFLPFSLPHQSYNESIICLSFSQIPFGSSKQLMINVGIACMIDLGKSFPARVIGRSDHP